MGDNVSIPKRKRWAATESDGKTPVQRIDIFEPGLSKRLNWRTEIDNNGIEQVIVNALKILERNSSFFPDHKAIPNEVLLHVKAQKLRQKYVDVRTWVEMVSGRTLQSPMTSQLLQEFLKCLDAVDLDYGMELWESVLRDSPDSKWLRANEPLRFHLEAERRRHEGFFEAVGAVPYFFPVEFITHKAGEAYGPDALSDDDRHLAEEWAEPQTRGKSEDQSKYVMAKMLSARAAEKVAMRFYERLGHVVRDVSVQQLDSPGGDWTTHDLEVDGRPIDVKNSRRPSSVSGYCEHTVKRLKRDRREQDGSITGVRSPYLQLQYLDEPSEIPDRWGSSVLVLGETARSELEDLRQQFTSDALLDLGIDRGRHAKEYLPPWVFNYPDEFYEEESARTYRAAVVEAVDQAPPSWDVVKYGNAESALSFYVQAGKPIPPSWRAALRPWQAHLVDRLMETAARQSLPHLFLSILTDFLKAIREGRKDYEPMEYCRLLYYISSGRYATHVPLGIYDPLESVLGLISS